MEDDVLKFKIKKALGQNFLKNEKICQKIVKVADVENSFVVEIGPGFGALTQELLKYAKKVVAVEKDKDFMPFLEKKFKGNSKLLIIWEDFLNLDFKKLVEEHSNGLKVVVCANLPYYITTPILFKILHSKLKCNLTLMVQKELAVRIVAKPGTKNCGAISALVHYFFKPEIVFNVSRGNFFPAPKVESAVIKLTAKEKDKTLKCEETFLKLVRVSFSQRRKILINPVSFSFNISKEILKEVLSGMGLKGEARAEELKLKDLIKLSNFIFKTKKS